MQDTSKSGRWLSYQINSMDDLVVAEPDRKLGDHIKNLATFNKAWSPQKKTMFEEPAFQIQTSVLWKARTVLLFLFLYWIIVWTFWNLDRWWASKIWSTLLRTLVKLAWLLLCTTSMGTRFPGQSHAVSSLTLQRKRHCRRRPFFFAMFFLFIKFKVFPKNIPLYLIILLAGGLCSHIWSPSQYGESAVLYKHKDLLEGQVAWTGNNPMITNWI